MSANKKSELVLQLLRGDSLDELCRVHNVTDRQLNEWRDIFINKAKDGFRKNANYHRLGEAQTTIGRQVNKILSSGNTEPYNVLH